MKVQCMQRSMHVYLLFITLATQSQPQPSSAIPQSHSRARLAILVVSCVLSESALLEVDSLVLSAVCNKTEQDHCLVILWSRSFARLLRKNTYNVTLFIPTEVVPQQTFPRYPRYRWGFPLKAPCLLDHGFQRFGRVGLQLALCAICCLVFCGYPPLLSWSIWKSLKQR